MADENRRLTESTACGEARAPRKHAKLSAAFARTVSKPGRYGDGNGLYLLVQPSGFKQWISGPPSTGGDVNLASAAFR